MTHSLNWKPMPKDFGGMMSIRRKQKYFIRLESEYIVGHIEMNEGVIWQDMPTKLYVGEHEYMLVSGPSDEDNEQAIKRSKGELHP